MLLHNCKYSEVSPCWPEGPNVSWLILTDLLMEEDTEATSCCKAELVGVPGVPPISFPRQHTVLCQNEADLLYDQLVLSAA